MNTELVFGKLEGFRAYPQSQEFLNRHARLNAVGYKEIHWVILAPLTETPDLESWGLSVSGSEKYSSMLIPQHLIISLFFFFSDTFADFPSSDTVDIPDLVAHAKQGDRNAVATLYQVFAQTIFRYIALRVPTNADAEDLTAEVFISMVKGLSSYQITDARFEAWLYRIAASRIADFYRQQNRRPQTELSETLIDSNLLPEEQILQNQVFDQLRKVLQQLPEDYQTILILRFVERKSHEEVAKLLDKSVSSVKSAQYRALKRLTELLGTNPKVRHYLRGTSRE